MGCLNVYQHYTPKGTSFLYNGDVTQYITILVIVISSRARNLGFPERDFSPALEMTVNL